MKSAKKALRQQVFEKIDLLSEEYVKRGDEEIFKKVISLPEFESANTLFVYYSTGREPDTIELIKYALSKGKTVTIPKIVGKGIMEASVVSSMESLVMGKFDIITTEDGAETIEPEKLDFTVVPAVAFDKDGYRLGYGGGYYDRFLIRTNAFSVGLARSKILMDEVPREAHDTHVDCVITEEKIARLK